MDEKILDKIAKDWGLDSNVSAIYAKLCENVVHRITPGLVLVWLPSATLFQAIAWLLYLSSERIGYLELVFGVCSEPDTVELPPEQIRDYLTDGTQIRHPATGQFLQDPEQEVVFFFRVSTKTLL